LDAAGRRARPDRHRLAGADHRNLVGNGVIESLVKADSVKPAGHAVYDIGTRMLQEVAQATVVLGIPLVFAAWLAGPMRPAIAARRFAAPTLRDQPGIAYAVVAAFILLIIAWGPIPATRMPIPVLIWIVLTIVGVQALRRQTAQEFPLLPVAPSNDGVGTDKTAVGAR